MIKPEQIPDEVVEAASKARYADQCAFASQFHDWPTWDDVAEQIRKVYRSEFRLQMVAALNAWPKAFTTELEDYTGVYRRIILPLDDRK